MNGIPDTTQATTAQMPNRREALQMLAVAGAAGLVAAGSIIALPTLAATDEPLPDFVPADEAAWWRSLDPFEQDDIRKIMGLYRRLSRDQQDAVRNVARVMLDDDRRNAR